MARRVLVVALLACVCRGWSAHAYAYSYASPFAKGCHEALSIAALRAVRDELVGAAPLHAGSADRAWIDDLPLELPDDARDLAAASLIVGVRDNDLKGHHGLDNAELAQVHGDPSTQREHCLRAAGDDEPDGSERALQACRDYIRKQVQSARELGLDARGRPDPDARMQVRVYLALAGQHDVPAVLAWLQLGRALHALQDSFSHTLRSPDGLRVRSVLNWIDLANDRLVETRDGPGHRRALDACTGLDPMRAMRRDLAIEASAALLRAALEPEANESVDAVLDRYLSFEPGCGANNHFCAAPELAFSTDTLACSARPGRAAGGAPAIALFWLAIALALRRRRRCRGAWAVALCVLAHAVAGGQIAHAQPACPSLPARTPIAPASVVAVEGTLGGSIDEAALAIAAGARYRASERWLVGLDAEWNPWASLEAERVRPGSLNVYASLIWRWLSLPDLALRTTGHVGASALLFDLYGAPAGSVGPYFGLSLLALEIVLTGHSRLLVEPADVRVPIPHLGAIPLSHRQYRASIGLELWL